MTFVLRPRRRFSRRRIDHSSRPFQLLTHIAARLRRRLDELIVRCRQRRHLVGLERPDQARRDEHHQLGLLGALGLALESGPMIGSLLRSGIAAASFCEMLFIRPAIANVCPSRSSTSVSARRVISAGMRNPESVRPLLKSSELTSGRTFSRITSPAMVGLKVRRMPNSLNTTGDRARGALHDRDRELAAGQEARFLAVVGDQVRFGEALEPAGRLQRLEHAADAVLAIEEEQVQEVAEHQPCLGLLVVEVGRGELLRRRPAEKF